MTQDIYTADPNEIENFVHYLFGNWIKLAIGSDTQETKKISWALTMLEEKGWEFVKRKEDHSWIMYKHQFASFTTFHKIDLIDYYDRNMNRR